MAFKYPHLFLRFSQILSISLFLVFKGTRRGLAGINQIKEVPEIK